MAQQVDVSSIHNISSDKDQHFNRFLTDFSKTVSTNIRSLLGGSAAAPSKEMPFASSSSAEEPMSLASLITGSNCIKTCGMEDIQFAARRAAELFITLRYCIIALSIVLVLYILLLIALKFAQLSDAVRAIKSPNHLGDSTSQFSKKISSSSSGDGSRTTGPLDRSNSIKETLAKLHASHDASDHQKSVLDVDINHQLAPETPSHHGICQVQSFAKRSNPVPPNAAFSFFGAKPRPLQQPVNQQQFPTLNDFLLAKTMAGCRNGNNE